MFDLAANLDYAQYRSPSVVAERVADVTATPPNWIGDDKGLLGEIQRKLKLPEQIIKSFYSYEPNGPLGMPRLTTSYPVDYAFDPEVRNKRVLIPQSVGFAQLACSRLDLEAKQAGAWGPECKIKKFLKLPEGKLIKATEPYAREGDYLYTPARIGTDTARFILENGAGKQVEVIFKITATSYKTGSLEEFKGARVESNFTFRNQPISVPQASA